MQASAANSATAASSIGMFKSWHGRRQRSRSCHCAPRWAPRPLCSAILCSAARSNAICTFTTTTAYSTYAVAAPPYNNPEDDGHGLRLAEFKGSHQCIGKKPAIIQQASLIADIPPHALELTSVGVVTSA
eukprot:NODE_20653_length_788_cov_5.301059.p3 GENE.NODE_20653_length_788_cov_5.301059~~NODE_20653_length_788_cov_5.301059.p3  ORF type:complete len:130 (+),score=11.72 NODE_20653_length_788_cov_5.301059:339-728(+)